MRPRDIGTRAETAVVRFLAANGFPHAERRSLKGSLDQGDVTGIPGVCIEVKGGDAARNASDGQVGRWLAETDHERFNARADVGVLVVQRLRQPVERWWATLPYRHLDPLQTDQYHDPRLWAIPLRLYLTDAAHLLRTLGYGIPVDD